MVQDAEQNPVIMRDNKSQWYKVPGYCTFYMNDDTKPMFY